MATYTRTQPTEIAKKGDRHLLCEAPEGPFGQKVPVTFFRPAGRRGVILLVLLGMLALFGATVFAFLVITAHSNQTAKSLQKVDRVTFSPRADADEAMRQLLRGSTDARSVIGPHGLLGDLYGRQTIPGWVINHYTVVPGASNPKGLPGNELPGFGPILPTVYQNQVGGGQLIEFTAGYTIPGPAPGRNGGQWGGLNPDGSGGLAGGTVGWTKTVPASFGALGNNTAANEPIGFQSRVGCVLTVIDPTSPLYNKSTRIVGYRAVEFWDGPPPTFEVIHHRYYLMPFEGVSAANAENYFSETEYGGDNFILSGVPFSGTGTGYNPATVDLSAGYGAQEPYALLPNPTDPAYGAYDSANEDYDAADYQNMFLAMERYDGTAMTVTRSPSFHRPALANYWLHKLAADYETATSCTVEEAWRAVIDPANYAVAAWVNTILNTKRRCLLRPLLEDHPNFDGSNPNWPNVNDINLAGLATVAELKRVARATWGAVDLAEGNTAPWTGTGMEVVPWDVDCDGDGIPDGVWLDVGLPVRNLPDGRQYKPLAAYHCIDMDGKLNANTAGTMEELFAAFRTNLQPGDHLGSVFAQNVTTGNPPVAATGLERGQGVGTAEVSLMPLLANEVGSAAALAAYENLLLGTIGGEHDGRYGEVARRITGGYPAPGVTGTLAEETPEALMLPALWGMTPTYNHYAAATGIGANAYGTPLGLRGAMAVGLDMRGNPIFSAMYGSAVGWNLLAYNGVRDIPYEMMLGPMAARSVGYNSRHDNPFSVDELEPLLRRYDADILRLPKRLRELLGAAPDAGYRRTLTTESWDIPTPGLAWSDELLTAWNALGTGRKPMHVTDLIAARVQAQTAIALPLGLFQPAEPRRVDTRALLSLDTLGGLRMDLNRPFGNGFDDNGNSIVDEPAERLLGTELYYYRELDGTGTMVTKTVPFDHDNDGIVADSLTDPVNLYRQAYARHLYVLMMALVDQDWYPYWDPQIANPVANDMRAAGWKQQEARARAIAQWAINVVDFRDSDSIMTPFEYDVYPFAAQNATTAPAGELHATWDVDGDLTTNENPGGNAARPRGVVWGCERPELLITETLAFHDTGIKDMATAPDPPDWKQRYMPQGSLFVELYNPQSPSESKPAELYDAASTGVWLQKTTPNNEPVWRMMVTTREGALDPHKYRYLNPEEPDLDREDRTRPVRVERTIYFAQPKAAGDPFPEPTLPVAGVGQPLPQHYPSVVANVNVAPGNYTVIGPGFDDSSGLDSVTHLGRLTAAGDARRIILTPGGATPVAVFGDGTTQDPPAVGAAINASSAVVINRAIDRVADGRTDEERRLSVSEPVDGYTHVVPPRDPVTFERIINPEENTLLDAAQPELVSVFGVPVKTNDKQASYRVVHLQRLADPLRDWDPDNNPYLTVDAAPVDLTMLDSTSNPNLDFCARQRGERSGAPGAALLWRTSPSDQDPVDIATPPDTPWPRTTGNPATHAFTDNFCHSLGYLNHPFGKPFDPAGSHATLTTYRGAANIRNSSDFEPLPFSWLTWLNRPFANKGELMQVPCVAPSQLLMAYEESAATDWPYLDGHGPFGHLPNFFAAVEHAGHPAVPSDEGKMNQYTQWGLAPWDNPDPIGPPRFHRLLEYVDVPSRFTGASTRGKPSLMAANPNEPHWFHPPFNSIPRYREPGRININTIHEPEVYAGMVNDMAGANPAAWTAFLNGAWTGFTDARRGYVTGSDNFGFDSNVAPLPTRVANPFRSFAGVQLIPPTTSTTTLDTVVAEGVNATLLRAKFDPANPLDLLENRMPLWTRTGMSVSTRLVDNTEKNPYFQYQPLQKMSSLATTRSNVYAVWITVGYFEVEQKDNFDRTIALHCQLYPEGFELGQELGIDTGDVTRHRSFYLIDRSIPVGFVPGEDLNTENAVLIRRFIE